MLQTLSALCSPTLLLAVVVLVLISPASAAAPPTLLFPDVTFKVFSDCIKENFASDVSLSTVLVLLYSLTENPEFLNLHGRQQQAKVAGERARAVTTWMAMFSRLLLGVRLRSARETLFKPTDGVILHSQEDYTVTSVNALSLKLNSLVSVLKLNMYKPSGKVYHRRKAISYKTIEPLYLLCSQSYQCETRSCPPRALHVDSPYRDVPRVTVLKGSDVCTFGFVLTGKCGGCETTYHADHDRVKSVETDEYDRCHLNGARYLKIGRELWADRVFTNSVLCATYSFHSSTSAFMDFWNESVGRQAGVKISHRQVWQAFILETLRMMAADQGRNLTLPDSYNIHKVAAGAYEALGANGVIKAAEGHACDECSHPQRFGPNEQEQDAEDFARVNMCVVDGIVMSPTHCAVEGCIAALAHARGGSYCEDHFRLYGHQCHVRGCNANCVASTKACQEHQADWQEYQETHSRSHLAGIRRMVSRPSEQLPWQDQRQNRQVQAHDEPALEDADVARKHDFGPSKFYCTETACYPCGVVIGWALFDKSESPTKILKFLQHIFPTPESKPSYICIDKGCQVFRTAITNGSFERLWSNSRFIVDTYHYNNHKRSDELCQTWCNPTPMDGSNPNLVIQELDRTGVLQWKRAFNTQASEQLNSWIAGYEQILKRMTVSNFYWFLHSVLYLHTKCVLQKQADRQIGLVIADLGVDVDDAL
ncbi:hypothetical protein DFP72DRAFT_820876 [Ephemerocybe angulata]|uniref:CxC6 like cysteine cluster associated with KDZ domain-containing protein n=1 Tax=Ephemerocybe angulata TaxID=980116 RepID=A0A8H6HKW9_9AGAR|nr:hypothetical protein DFP72DRAFT_820876 [Tulosesus angulatus]